VRGNATKQIIRIVAVMGWIAALNGQIRARRKMMIGHGKKIGFCNLISVMVDAARSIASCSIEEWFKWFELGRLP
jgi:hypothetical protein